MIGGTRGDCAVVAINLPSDIVMDVARAVEPAGVQAARAEMMRRSGGSASASAGFSIDDAGGASVVRANAGGATPEAFVKFESMVLQTFVQSMLPKDGAAVYGDGISGEMWKSLLAQQLGEVIAQRGGIGIADSILANHYFEGETKVAVNGVSGGAEKSDRDTQDLLSSALVQEIQRKLTQSLAADEPAMPREP